MPLRRLSGDATGLSGNVVSKALAATSSLSDVKQAVRDVDERVVRQHYDISLLNPTVFGVYHIPKHLRM